MSKETRDILTDLLIAVVVLFLSLPFFCAIHAKPDEVVKSDTVYVYDTIRIVEPIPIKEEVIKYVNVYLPTTDTIVKIDSIEVVVPIVQKVYENSEYKAWVSGYEPSLDSINIYNTTKYYPVVETVKIKPKIAISAGVYGGFGVKGADYGLGIMVGVPIWSW